MILGLLIATVVAPALVAGALAAATRFLAPWSRLRRSAAPAALALGYATGHLAIAGAPRFPPIETTQGLFYLSLLAGGLAMAAAGAGDWTRRALRLLTVALTVGLSLFPLIRHQWSGGEAAVAVAAFVGGSLLLQSGYDRLAERLSFASARAAWIVVFAAAAALLLFARTALLAQLASTVAVALTATVLLDPAPGGGAPVAPAAGLAFLAPMLHAFALNGVYYAELGAPAAVALAASPFAAAIALAVRRGPRLRAAVAAASVAVLIGPFVARAAVGYLTEDRGDYYDYDP